MKLTDHFSRQEFDSGDGAVMPDEVLENVLVVAQNLEVLRLFFGGKSIKINSGYRSPSHNDAIGGAKNSQHKLGTAADVVVSGVAPSAVADAMEGLIRVGLMSEGGIGRYDSFTHYDIRGIKARWNG